MAAAKKTTKKAAHAKKTEPKKTTPKSSVKTKNTWSARVTATSNAMDVAPGTFAQKDPEKIATALERDAERSTRRKEPAYRSAMSMLTFYINRAGTNLSATETKTLEEAKTVLRARFGPAATESQAAKKPRPSTKSRRSAAR